MLLTYRLHLGYVQISYYPIPLQAAFVFYAKCMDNEKKIHICKKNDISISDAEFRNPFLLHAKVGGHLAKTKYKVDDEDIIGDTVAVGIGSVLMEECDIVAEQQPCEYGSNGLQQIA